jgi:hypothetical protein
MVLQGAEKEGFMEKAMHGLIQELSKTKPQCKNLTSGYIGNFGPWGDDRELRVWADGKIFWDCRAEKLDASAFNDLIQRLNAKYYLEIKGYSHWLSDDVVYADLDPDCDSGPGM